MNNAGRSIRRSALDSTVSPHDHQRTVSLNYSAAVQLSLVLLPGMVECGAGRIVNICTRGLW
ncbi:SDR family NAD(P)-dependent oxidoreductase [Gordonia oryzae]|uniref:SDR family NAD(P)-dependent oxidoreductase n=1 Tax=Gordonia oryzae TaxID=2487349 RepID=UPI001FE8DF5E|nr:SDR family NAD(P)-dependent oxidoreductase [Gordonia oryzae]